MNNFLQKRLKNKNIKYVYLVIIVLFFFSFGYFFGNVSTHNLFSPVSASEGNVNSSVDVSHLINEIQSNLDRNYISWKSDNQLPNENDLKYGMIKGYVNAYNDPYTEFFTPEESKQFEEDIKGSFGGIGALVGSKNNNSIIISVLKGTPAEAAGLESGDIIVSVDDQSVLGFSVDKVVNLIRGEIGKNVSLGVIREGESKTNIINITRAKIETPIINTEIKNDTYIIHFYSFTEDSASKFEIALQNFITSGKKNLIIDLRNNGGGYLDSAVDIASLFLPKNQVVVVEKSLKDLNNTDYSKGYNYLSGKKYNILLLINGGTASAAEILAGALKDNGVAKIAGQKSFGKGSVQQLIKLSDGSDLKVTVAKWYTPNGVNISENGIEPDIQIPSSEDVKTDDNKLIDTELDKAVEIIESMK